MFMVQTLISLINLGQQDFSKGLQVPIGTHRELSFSNGAGASTKITTKVSSFQLVWSGSLLLTISGRSYHVKGTCKFRLCSPFMYHNQFGSIHRTVYKYIWWNRWPYETWPEEDNETCHCFNREIYFRTWMSIYSYLLQNIFSTIQNIIALWLQ